MLLLELLFSEMFLSIYLFHHILYLTDYFIKITPFDLFCYFHEVHYDSLELFVGPIIENIYVFFINQNVLTGLSATQRAMGHPLSADKPENAIARKIEGKMSGKMSIHVLQMSPSLLSTELHTTQ